MIPVGHMGSDVPRWYETILQLQVEIDFTFLKMKEKDKGQPKGQPRFVGKNTT